MKILILGSKKSKPTALALAKCFRNNYLCDYADSLIDLNSRYNIVMRYGNSYTSIDEVMGEPFMAFNKANRLTSIMNKYYTRELLLSNGISCPRLITVDDLSALSNFPIVGRPQYHQCGKNFKLIRSTLEAEKYLRIGYYLQEFINKQEEYRIFMFRGTFMETNKKIPSSPNAYANNLIRNFHNGWIFEPISYKLLNKNVLNTCRNISKIIDLDFFALDIGIDNDGEHYVFEINTAPRLIDRKINLLKEKILSTYFSMYPS